MSLFSETNNFTIKPTTLSPPASKNSIKVLFEMIMFTGGGIDNEYHGGSGT
jgi:hypothetical protein